MNTSTKVLLVEDERVTYKAIANALQQYGFQYEGATTLSDARHRIRKEKFDIIISDIKLPDGTGIDLLVEIRKFMLDIPFVAITASDNGTLMAEALQNGADDFLSKPFNLNNISTIVRRNLERQKLAKKNNGPRKASALLKAIKALVTALEAKDSYTSGHSLRVARQARSMGIELKLPENELFTLELAAILHDVGKIGMPDSILKKATSLHDREFNTAKEHTIVGSKIVGNIDELKEIAAIIRHHHERYDGTGYPDGLKGEVIPFYARLLAIVDAYESIVSNRTYDKPRSSLQAIAELEKHAGTQFDPHLVRIFGNIIRENRWESVQLEFEK
ncbi:MAG: response regulator [Caldithrix sp.]|nr:response regulator [Caldithrix sp.]